MKEEREAIAAAMEEGLHRLDERRTIRILLPSWEL